MKFVSPDESESCTVMWSPDETRERSDWQSADWDSSDQTHRALLGSRFSLDHDIIFMDPYNRIHGDEKNVCS